MINWYFGWGSLLAAFVSGAALGLYFHRDDFLRGYQSFERRLLRLGHISLAALGIVNVLFAQAAIDKSESTAGAASLGFIVGGVAMPAVCFLTAWRPAFRHLFFIPVTALIVAVIQTLRIGMP